MELGVVVMTEWQGVYCVLLFYLILLNTILWPHEWLVCCQDDLYTVSLNCDTL